jgi:hypothetical protein
VLTGSAEAAEADVVQAAAASCVAEGFEAHYPTLGSPPTAEAIHTKGGSGAPLGAGCFDKTESAATWITVASVVRAQESVSSLIGRFGAISGLLSAQYWSTTDQKWRPLVSSASAIPGPESTKQRADFSVAELVTGDHLYYTITDTRSGRANSYRLRVREAQAGRVVVETSNTKAIKEWGVTLYAPDGLHTVYFLNERSPGVWAYYSITRVLPASLLATGHEKSYINRAVALYRHYMRLATDAEPPAAP